MILKQLFIPHIVLHLFPHELVFLAKECVVAVLKSHVWLTMHDALDISCKGGGSVITHKGLVSLWVQLTAKDEKVYLTKEIWQQLQGHLWERLPARLSFNILNRYWAAAKEDFLVDAKESLFHKN